MKISVCIPTHRRPHLLKECVDSCVNQSHPPAEILIGDDSSDDRTEKWIRDYRATLIGPIHLQYFRNFPPLGQAKNVDMLFHKTSGDLIALIHDDDLFCEGALELLGRSFSDPEVAVAYGKQLIADESGTVDLKQSERVNEIFYRTENRAEAPKDFLEAALLQQFPNDGFLVRAEIAKQIGYLDAERVMGDAADYGFSILCARAFPQMKARFINTFTAMYRRSAKSIARNNPRNNGSFNAFKYVSKLDSDITSRPKIRRLLASKAPVAIVQAINLKRKKEAARIYFSKWHRSKILTLGGLKRGVLLLTN